VLGVFDACGRRFCAAGHAGAGARSFCAERELLGFKGIMKRIGLLVVAVSALALAGDVPRGRLAEPDYLPPLARELLRTRMQQHGDQMMRLVMAVTLLQRERAYALATDIANEPRLTKPIAGGENDLNVALPDQLFVLQDELRSRAKAVAEAANKPSDVALAKALGRVTETCVACHSAFLHPE
jgi:hypothetical protein